jgi:cysteine desulfurase
MSSPTRAYFDYNATAPLYDVARAKLLEALDITSNPSSIHSHGRAGRKLIEDARSSIGEIFDITPNQIIFTSGATEANNTILKGFQGKRILVAATEHLSVIESGVDVTIIPVDENGIVNLDSLTELLKAEPTTLVSVMYVNNETGIIQPVKEIAKIVHEHGALFHCDAAQAVGRISFTRASVDADFITITAHKFGGMIGTGAIIFKPQISVPVLLHGGGHERRQRAGTMNFIAISAFGEACREAISRIEQFQKLEIWRNEIEEILVKNHYPVFGQKTDRVANTICFAHNKKDSQTLMMAFDLNGISLSSGSACSSGTVQESRVLKAMSVPTTYLHNNLRLSMGWNTTRADIDLFLTIWDKIR